MATTLKVSEKSLRKLFEEMNDSAAAKASPKKLVKKAIEFAESVNGDLDDYELSTKSRSLVEQIGEAIEDETEIELLTADAEETPKKGPMKQKKTPSKKAAQVKAAKGAKSVKAEKSEKSEKRKGSYNPEYAQKRKEQGQKIRNYIVKNPGKTYAEIAAKIGCTENRIAGHVKFNKGRYEVKKGNKVFNAGG